MAGKLAKVTDVTDCATVDAMLQKSVTDWDIRTVTAWVDPNDSSQGVIDPGGYRALVRPDTHQALAFVGERFHANNHRAQLHTLDTLVESGDLVPTSVSVWDNGAILAYQFRAPGLDVTVRGKDMVSPLLTLAFAYGSKLADTSFFADFRWFCKNQMGMVAKVNDKESRCKHRGGIVDRFGDILAGRISQLSGELSGRYNTMRRMTEAPLQRGRALAEYFGEVLGLTPEELDGALNIPPNKLRGDAGKIPEILDCYLAEDSAEDGTVWRAYNAVTRYETHHAGRNEATRNRRMLLGSGGAVASRAWDIAARIAA